MKLTKKSIAMLATLLICFILKGDIFHCPYYTYQFDKFKQYADAYINNILGYISVFLVFACGFFEIYDLKRLGLIFLTIQPAKLIMDILDTFMSDHFGLRIFYPLLGLSLLFILIYLADLFIRNRSSFKESICKSLKQILIALVVSIVGHIAAIIIIAFINILYLNVMTKISDDDQMINCTILYNITSLFLGICLFVAIIMCLRGILNKIYISKVCETKAVETSLTAITIIMPIAYTAYYLLHYVNPIFYYIEILEETKGLPS